MTIREWYDQEGEEQEFDNEGMPPLFLILVLQWSYYFIVLQIYAILFQ